jgi:hypothetical protein
LLSNIYRMKHKKIKLTILLLGLILTAEAQQAITSSGGDASGSGGTIAYSVGQIGYNFHTGITGSVVQGVQQPYEIYIVMGENDRQISLNIQAYPNPTSDYLTLNIGNIDILTLSFQLIELGGKIIESKKITSSIETIRMENLPSSTYFLKIRSSNKEGDERIFKIIKN